MELGGWASLDMVLRYAHLAPENLRSAVSRLDGVLPATIQPQHNDSTTGTAGSQVRAGASRNY